MTNKLYSDNKYTKMQQSHYDSEAETWNLNNRDPVVGTFDQHNDWQDYNDFLFKNINTQDKNALDFGCGPGRCIVQFSNRFKHIDGTDISQKNLDNAMDWCQHNNLSFTPTLYKCNGVDLSEITNNMYDIVYSTICMQHICVYDIRFNLFKEFYRVLRSGGSICIQMGFGNIHPNGVKYYDNHYDAISTNGFQDVMIDDVNQIKTDLENIGYINFDFDLRPTGPGDNRHSQWIFFRANKPA